MFAATDDTLPVNFDLVGHAEGHNLLSNFDAQFREIIATTVAPLESSSSEGLEGFGCFDIAFEVSDFALALTPAAIAAAAASLTLKSDT